MLEQAPAFLVGPVRHHDPVAAHDVERHEGERLPPLSRYDHPGQTVEVGGPAGAADDLAVVARFERAARQLRAGAPSLATVAATCGYYDQAHLAREVAELAGCSPTRLRAEELPSVQDGDDPHPSR